MQNLITSFTVVPLPVQKLIVLCPQDIILNYEAKAQLDEKSPSFLTNKRFV